MIAVQLGWMLLSALDLNEVVDPDPRIEQNAEDVYFFTAKRYNGFEMNLDMSLCNQETCMVLDGRSCFSKR